MLLNVDQVAERLNVRPPTVWRYCRIKPDFPRGRKLSPGCTRWRADEIEQWINSR